MFTQTQISHFRKLKTPFYFYDLELLKKTLNSVKEHGLSKGYHIHYAVKANFNLKILDIIRRAGLGIDCVSGKEVERAIESGFDPDQIAFAGVGKTDEEILTGLRHNIFSFNCESLQEVEVLNTLAKQEGKKARISIRLNPNVAANTHKYITTGLNENKFGVNPSELPALFEMLPNLDHVELTGIHFHIGSQIEDLDSFRNLCKKVNVVRDQFKEKNIPIHHINVGGGLGIDYNNPDKNAVPDFKTFFGIFDELLHLEEGQELHFELGRSIIGQSGSLISQVLFIKEGISTHFAIIDAGMTELIRPALYQAKHHIDVLTSNKEPKTYDVAGPICESSDTFRTGITLPEMERGDLVAIRSCGAYGQVMSSDYNLRERAAAVYSDEIVM
ncbi:MAG: diaminopimelate decarboxylase [Balneolaceae bacterium]